MFTSLSMSHTVTLTIVTSTSPVLLSVNLNPLTASFYHSSTLHHEIDFFFDSSAKSLFEVCGEDFRKLSKGLLLPVHHAVASLHQLDEFACVDVRVAAGVDVIDRFGSEGERVEWVRRVCDRRDVLAEGNDVLGGADKGGV